MASTEEAQRAIQFMTDVEVCGRKVRCNEHFRVFDRVETDMKRPTRDLACTSWLLQTLRVQLPFSGVRAGGPGKARGEEANAEQASAAKLGEQPGVWPSRLHRQP